MNGEGFAYFHWFIARRGESRSDAMDWYNSWLWNRGLRTMDQLKAFWAAGGITGR